MSEPVSNAEIEDVLSSIRRLVSENTGAKDEATSQAETTEKLVLTPAFRVLENPASPSEDNSDSAESGTAEDEDPRAKILRELSERDAVETATPQDSDTDRATENPQTDTPEGEGLERRIAELEAAIGETYDEWEPDGSEEEGSEAAPIIFKMAEAKAPEQDEPAAENDEMVQDFEVELAAEVEVEVEIEPEAELEAPAQSELLEPDLDAVTEDAFLDEETLRDMVSQIVREELQGAIGERITSNVRRLVRREIKRALAVRDLE